MNKQEVKKLAELSRLHIEEAEMETLASELEAILGYVEDVKKVVGASAEGGTSPLKNVFRDDGNPHESGIYTDKILKGAPETERGYLKVKKIL